MPSEPTSAPRLPDAPDGADVARVVIIDDHQVVAAGLGALLDRDDGLEVVAIAGTLADGADAVVEHAPDVVLLDYRLPDADGVMSIGSIREHTDVPIVVITADPSPQVLARALEAGAAGFVRKTGEPREAVASVRAAARGDALIDPELLTELSQYLRHGHPGDELTERELQVLRLVASGRTTEDIADELFLSIHTVRNHVRGALQALGAHSKLEAVATALRNGILTVEDLR